MELGSTNNPHNKKKQRPQPTSLNKIAVLTKLAEETCMLLWGKLRISLGLVDLHGTGFETMAILVKALKCVTKRLRAFP